MDASFNIGKVIMYRTGWELPLDPRKRTRISINTAKDRIK